ncbi:MAG: polyprenyl synthetase family protein [Lachnospiraceae bacterium]|jgi:geranylgeranyl diphosphate synthase type II|nr:polyprenyl synthetase family protein [Lachnospiraceae bacterium]MCI9401291.1 polyprenyl synthetase family protein [Lachnospiraceae bacterium]
MSLENQFEQELHNRAENIDKLLESYLPKEEGWAKCVAEAMNYSITAKGKRLRPMLMQETYQMFGGTGKEIMPFMAAIEMIHTYSLVHDDLPAMDNDEYRRGRKTTHVVYGEAMAILAGDGLLNYAFETALQAFAIESIDTAKAVKALTILAGKAGIYGMIGGQTADIEAENLGNQVTEEHLLFIHEHKTAALIQAAMMIGAVLGGADEAQTAVVEQAAYEIGIAFQIQDDILDVTSSLEVLGKQVGSDEKNNKTTYVTLKGLETASTEQKELSNRAIERLEGLQKDIAAQKNTALQGDFLLALIRSLITRVK